MASWCTWPHFLPRTAARDLSRSGLCMLDVLMKPAEGDLQASAGQSQVSRFDKSSHIFSESVLSQ
eukprot:4851407-Pyramimonas_sp.AAC.1